MDRSPRPSEPRIDFTVVIACYNHRAFIAEAIDSALAQTHPPAEIVVVDDGSDDGSGAVVAERYATEGRVRLLHKPNGGAASAVSAGLAAAGSGWLALLDADDVWEPGYLARVAAVYRAHPHVDYVFANMRYFGDAEGLYLPDTGSREFGPSILRGAYRPVWRSSASSAISLRTALARRIFSQVPEEALMSLRSHNDDLLSLGANILGARKYFVSEALVRYRSHGRNTYLSLHRRRDPADQLQRWLAFQWIVEHFCAQRGLDPARKADQLCFLKHEFRSQPAPDSSDLRAYWHLAGQSALPWPKRLEQRLAMLAHLLRTRLGKGGRLSLSSARSPTAR